PLGPILDVATIVTGGAGAVAKTGGALARAGAISDASRLARLGRASAIELRSPAARVEGEGLKISGKSLSRNPAIRARQVALDKAMKRLPPTTPLLGEYARFARELDRLPRQDALRLQHHMEPYSRA